MTTYGTIPRASENSADIISEAKERIKSTLESRRPWTEMIQVQSFNFPSTFDESLNRIKANAVFFRANYAIIISFILMFSLLWHPFSLISFISLIAAWSFLYFLRDDPLIVFGVAIYDNFVMVFLVLTTLIVIYSTNVTNIIVVALFIGVMVIMVHGSLRTSDDLVFLDDEEGFGTPASLHRPEGNRATGTLRNAASNSFGAS